MKRKFFDLEFTVHTIRFVGLSLLSPINCVLIVNSSTFLETFELMLYLYIAVSWALDL